MRNDELLAKLEELQVRSFSGSNWRSAPMLDREDVMAIVRQHTEQVQKPTGQPVDVEAGARAIQEAWWNRLKARRIASGAPPSAVKEEHVAGAKACAEAWGLAWK